MPVQKASIWKKTARIAVKKMFLRIIQKKNAITCLVLRQLLYGKTWKTLKNHPEKRAVLSAGGALRDQILDAFVAGELLRWKTELISRIIPENRAIVRSCKEIQTNYVTDQDSYNWNKLNGIRGYLAKDSIDEKSLFTLLVNALNENDYAAASGLQVEMYDKIQELKALYTAYTKNMI